jgi:hypothetical protein
MKLADRLQTLKPPGETVRQIPKERVDELLQVITLVGADRGRGAENVAPHRDARQLRPQAADLHLLDSYLRLAGRAFQGSCAMCLDLVAQGLLDHSQAALSHY